MAFPGIGPIRVPESFTVWAGSDAHGQLDAFDRLLASAGLTDGAERWIAPPATALVITGDVVDRGPASVGLARRLVSLREQAPGHGGLVALLEGNHEVQVLGGLAGDPAIFRALMAFGGIATLLSAGMAPGEWDGMDPLAIGARVDRLVPGFLADLRSFAPYATWGDVLLVHGGPVQGMELDAWEAGAERLWIREAFFEAPEPFPEADAWTAFRRAGLVRVVHGHTPMAGPRFSHEDRVLNLDTWRGGVVTLAGLAPGRPLTEARFLAEPVAPRTVADAPITREEIQEIDAAMPDAVRAWWASLRARA